MEKRKEMKGHDLLAPILRSPDLTFVHARGAEYTDDQGRCYVDMLEMCQVLGQNNVSYIQAMTAALGGITTGKTGFSAPKAELYNRLLKVTRGDFEAIHLMSSGSEAVEWAVQLAKKITGRTEVISFWNSIHGRTSLSASLSGLPRRKAGYGPLAPGVVLVPYPRCCDCPLRESCAGGHYPCLEYIKQQYTYGSAQDAAAILVEPWQGARIDIAPVGWMEALYRWAKEQGMLFIMDEIQSGMGRSGELFCYQRYDFVPDMLLLGKALGNGMHISALLTRVLPGKEALPAVSGGTGDEALGCTAACQVFRQLEEGLLDHVRRMGSLLEEGLKPLQEREAILDVRCAGLAAAVEFRRAEDCAKVCAGLTEAGFFIGRVENCLICKPPYVITLEEIQNFSKTIDILVKNL